MRKDGAEGLMMHKAAAQVRSALDSLGRVRIVWGSLLASMTAVAGLLLALDARPSGGGLAGEFAGGFALAGVQTTSRTTTGLDAILHTSAPIKPGHWRGIVIHHSGSSSGSAASIAGQHLDRGFKGLGYHFVISNGQGAPDGQIHVGYRWMQQAPGAHATGPDADRLNRETIGVCLIGDGDRRSFTDAQLASLASLVALLQEAADIGAGGVHLSRDVSPTSGPGRLFPEASFRQTIALSR